ncbi:ATP-dependent RNA helicase DbpA [Alteromonas halophila]|uniref:ATP-dependent RNA helicase n=1 Tax=Alteromonas halophila TaxID=516698 RepID=A0A918MYY5_9ALTE|nr:ATP-dependent RNA helicase DbpA [Alteromonas halophila]GGW83340.1 ATP-dependent RNA helicase [Alteromonas halophila]
MQSFSSLPLDSAVIEALSRNGITAPSPIQQASLEHALTGRDIQGMAQTGSGKTLCFALPIVNKLNPSLRRPQAVILCPTRELAAQVAEQCRMVASHIPNIKVLTLCGGQPMGPDIQSLKHGCHIVVGTPGRLAEHLEKRRLDLSQVTTRVLDEADRMLDMGFIDSVDAIFAATPNDAQSLFFSATFPEPLAKLAHRYQLDPEVISVTESSAPPAISEVAYHVLSHTREQSLKAVLTHYKPSTAMVFCNTRQQVVEVVASLTQEGFVAAGLQGDMEQHARNAVLMQFELGALQVLVATDVAARGLDISSVDCVINYTLSEDMDTHTHRVGRTARAGETGQAVSLIVDDDLLRIEQLAERLKRDIPVKGAQALRFHKNRIVMPDYTAIMLGAGKKQKLRPGDILGALTQEAGIPGDDIGKIAVRNSQSFVAVKTRSVKRAMAQFREGKIKGKKVRARKLA